MFGLHYRNLHLIFHTAKTVILEYGKKTLPYIDNAVIGFLTYWHDLLFSIGINFQSEPSSIYEMVVCITAFKLAYFRYILCSIMDLRKLFNNRKNRIYGIC